MYVFCLFLTDEVIKNRVAASPSPLAANDGGEPSHSKFPAYAQACVYSHPTLRQKNVHNVVIIRLQQQWRYVRYFCDEPHCCPVHNIRLACRLSFDTQEVTNTAASQQS